jgi:hypothetical protein
MKIINISIFKTIVSVWIKINQYNIKIYGGYRNENINV